jgi:hypothetical protein
MCVFGISIILLHLVAFVGLLIVVFQKCQNYRLSFGKSLQVGSLSREDVAGGNIIYADSLAL